MKAMNKPINANPIISKPINSGDILPNPFTYDDIHFETVNNRHSRRAENAMKRKNKMK